MALLGAQFVNAVSPNPVGSLQAYAGASAPTGWLLCDGTSYSTTVYPELFNVLGYTYGGDPPSNFLVPDLRGRVPMGAGTGTGLTARSLGATVGTETHTLTTAQMPSHTHTQNSHNHTQNPHNHYIYSGPAGGPHPTIQQNGNNGALYGPVQTVTATNNATTATNQNTGGGGSHPNVQPSLVTNYIIKAVPDAPRSGLAYGSTPPIVTALPANPQFGDVVTYKHTATGNIGAHLPMQYDGTKWQPLGEAILARWGSGGGQTFSSTTPTALNMGTYNTQTFTPPWDGWYEVTARVEHATLTTGIGMYYAFRSTDGAHNVTLNYVADANGYTYHTNFGFPNPQAASLSSAKTYRFYGWITYPYGNTGYMNFASAHIKAVAG
jgi:microcystin-dependent protein